MDEDGGGGAVAERQVDDGPLGVGEPAAVDEEGGDGEGAGGEGDQRPGQHPRLREAHLLDVEEGDVVVARRPAVLDHLKACFALLYSNTLCIAHARLLGSLCQFTNST